MKRITLSLIAFLLCLCIQAQHRSEQEAIQIAQEFFAKKQMNKAPRLSVVPQQKVSQQIQRRVASAKKAPAPNSSFYIINDEENNRFVIVAADERMFQILGYSDNGKFEAEKMPVALLEMFDGYDKQYDMLIKHTETFEHNSPQRSSTTVIEPLIKTKWGQDSPYNDECPTNKLATESTDSPICYSGCVATAMAQVMNYYKYPSTGVGSYTYRSSTQKHIQSCNFGATSFNWDNLVNVYGNDATDKQKAEVAKLMHACGVSVSMDYGEKSDGQSGALPYDIPYGMITYFGYNPNISFMKKDYYSSEEWDSIIMRELEANRPIIYAGYGSGGHCFILDGCDGNGLYHFNFGFTLGGDFSYLDGYGNGYYSLDAIIVKDALITFLTGIEELGNYTDRQNMICHISPSTVGNHEDVFYATSFNILAYSSVKIGNSVNCWFNATNYSSSTSSTDNQSEKFKGEVGIGLYDTKWNFIKSLYSENFSKHSYESAWIDHDVVLDASSFNSGKQYFIAPYAKATSSEVPTRIRTNYGKGWYLVEVDGVSVTLTKNGEPESAPDYPEIPTGTIYASASGAGDKQISNTSEKPTIWQLTLTKDTIVPGRYWIDNFDPAVVGSNNCVYGFIDKAGTQLSIPVGQTIGNNLTITNYSNSGDIVVSVSPSDSTMLISDAWGTLEAYVSGGNTKQKQLSFYATTHFSFKPFPSPEPDPVVIIAKPHISVDDSKIMSITCSTSGVDKYYTLNGTEPTRESTKYSSPIKLTGNCVIKAIAIKDDNISETAIYEEKGFVVSPPSITQTTEFEVEMSCSTVGATIYYTVDGTKPTEKSTKYIGRFTPDGSCVIKAIGIMQNRTHTNSEVVTFPYIKPGGELVVNGNIAGNLPTRISESEKASTKGLIVSGDLNGTDIAFIRDMIINGSLTDLNIENSNIVSGGNPYYVSEYGTADYTSDNIVGKNMFEDCSNLISLKLPSSVTVIASFSFWGCTNMKELILPISCITVESNSFYGCTNLEAIYLGQKIEKIDGDNFSGCKNLSVIDVNAGNAKYKSIDGVLYTTDGNLVKYPVGRRGNEFIVPNDVTCIGLHAFEEATIETIKLPNELIAIGSSAFADCKNLRNIVIPNNVETIGYMAFWGCTNLYSILMPESLSKIESGTFDHCINLREFTIEKNVQEIAEDAFDNCTSLQKYIVNSDNAHFLSDNGILYSKDFKTLKRCPQALYSNNLRIPDGVETIAPHAFEECININSFILPETLNRIGYSAFSDCKMTSIIIPNSVDSIGSMSFWGCDELQTLSLPDGLNTIPNSILYNCKKLEYLYIPSSVNKIESSAFDGCESLTTIECLIDDIDKLDVFYLASFDEYTPFTNIPDTCTWIIQCKCNEADTTLIGKYKSQSWWNPNWRIIQPVCDGIDMVVINTNTLRFHEGKPIVTADSDGIIRVFSFDGILLQSINVKKGEQCQIDLPRGIYIINNKKIVIK